MHARLLGGTISSDAGSLYCMFARLHGRSRQREDGDVTYPVVTSASQAVFQDLNGADPYGVIITTQYNIPWQSFETHLSLRPPLKHIVVPRGKKNRLLSIDATQSFARDRQASDCPRAGGEVFKRVLRPQVSARRSKFPRTEMGIPERHIPLAGIVQNL